MQRKVRIEIDENSDEEIVIKCRKLSDDITELKNMLECGPYGKDKDIEVFLCDKTYIIKLSEVLFFESSGRNINVHTSNRIYTMDSKLYELEKKLPYEFIRISKSDIVNIALIESLKRDFSGICEVGFIGTDKKAYVSRMYYHPFHERFNEVRLSK